MDVKYINPFINASISVFSTFAGIESRPGPPAVRKQPLGNKEVNGFISLNGHGISGYFIINFSSGFLKQILAAIFDHPKASVEEIRDLAGELTNMITGSAKAELSKKGYFFDVAVPRISHTAPAIPDALKNNPVIVVPFDTAAGEFHIEASIQRIEEDFHQDTMPEVKPPEGYVSVETFARNTRMDPVKVRRLLKTGFLTGRKISNRQWHIPEPEFGKIQGYRPPRTQSPREADPMDDTVSLDTFSRLTGLSPTKIKSFLRTGFLMGVQDADRTWRINRDQVSKFKKHG